MLSGDRERGGVEESAVKQEGEGRATAVLELATKKLLAEDVVETPRSTAEERRERTERPEDDDLVESGAQRSWLELYKN